MSDCGDFVDSTPNDQRQMVISKKRWSDAEDRFISSHRTDGYLLIAEGLEAQGRHRSPESVRLHARRDLGIRLGRYPDSGMRKCVDCGRWDARPGTQAGNAGFCPTCWTRRKTRAYLEGREEQDARREYEREKKRRRRSRGRRKDAEK